MGRISDVRKGDENENSTFDRIFNTWTDCHATEIDFEDGTQVDIQDWGDGAAIVTTTVEVEGGEVKIIERYGADGELDFVRITHYDGVTYPIVPR